MLQVWLYFIFSQQYHIVFQHKPALKSTLVTSAALLWCSGISWLPPFPSRGRLQPRLAMAGHRVHLFPLSYVATTYSPLSVAWHRGRKQLDVPISLSVPRWQRVVPTSARSALPDFTFPIHRLSWPMEKSKSGQVLMFKAQVKSLPHRVLFTFPIVLLMALGSWLCFSQQTRKFESNSRNK